MATFRQYSADLAIPKAGYFNAQAAEAADSAPCAGAALGGRADKKPRRGRGGSPQDDAIVAEEAEFDVADAAPPPRGDADAEPAPMETEQTVVVAAIITTVRVLSRLAGFRGHTWRQLDFGLVHVFVRAW